MVFATEESLERLFLGIENEQNRAIAREWADRKRANARKLSTVISQLNHVRAWAEFLGQRAFASATEKHVRDFLLTRNVTRRWRPRGVAETSRTVRLSDGTIELRKVVLRNFQCFVRGCGKRDKLPAEVAWLEARPRSGDDEMPVDENDLLTRQDLEALIKTADHLQWKAIFATLFDSGMRASEFTSLKIRSVMFDEFGAVLVLSKKTGRSQARGQAVENLKTGARRVRVLNCAPYLRAWLNAHPQRDNPNAPLWVITGDHAHGQPLLANYLGYGVRKYAKTALPGRHVWPHLFRHSRATELALEGMPEGAMKIHLGWSKSSDMPSRYIHLSGRDVDQDMLRRAGKLSESRQYVPALLPKVCLCGEANAATSERCERPTCGRPLTIHAAQSQQDSMVQAVLDTLKKNPAMYAGIGNDFLRQGLRAANGE